METDTRLTKRYLWDVTTAGHADCYGDYPGLRVVRRDYTGQIADIDFSFYKSEFGDKTYQTAIERRDVMNNRMISDIVSKLNSKEIAVISLYGDLERNLPLDHPEFEILYDLGLLFMTTGKSAIFSNVGKAVYEYINKHGLSGDIISHLEEIKAVLLDNKEIHYLHTQSYLARKLGLVIDDLKSKGQFCGT